MEVLIIEILVWAIGVCVAKRQILKWDDEGILCDCLDREALSLLSWGVYILYFTNWVKNK